MRKHLCIHGHFYQPPREDPWQNDVLPEGSAAPSLNWNQRITSESYAPMARARRLDGAGRIAEVMNCYEWMSFNAGPTLLSWMDKADPDTVRLMAEADKASLARLGHGNAMAQVYHHQILPLASQLDKELEVSWAVCDFQARFGRAPEGMWLAETAVDTASLEVLAAHRIAFTILAPRQANAVAPVANGHWTPVDQDSLDIRQPYLVKLPSGRSIHVFFYDGPLSQAVAFERLLADGEGFWRKISAKASPGLLTLATDGETYGHHFTFGEMALAFVLDQARQERDGLALTNFAAYLAANPPQMQVRLHEPSAWSCVHGVDRWRSACGCTDGGHPGWHQQWRGPLRQALQAAKDLADQHYFRRGGDCFTDPRAALTDYGRVLAGLDSQDSFAADHFRKKLPEPEHAVAWKLLSMQQWGLASMASCAWFFDEISRIEPVNALTFALRAAELCARTGGPDIEAAILPLLQTAISNVPELGDGAGVWRGMVKPRQESQASLAAQALLTLHAQERMPQAGSQAVAAWPGVAVTIAPETSTQGSLSIAWALETGHDEARYTWTPPKPGTNPLAQPVTVSGPAGQERLSPSQLPVNKRQALADAFARNAADISWRACLSRMDFGAHLVTELQQAQTTMTLAPLWAGMWACLTWQWLWGLELSAPRRGLLLTFLDQARGSALECEGLMERVRARALEEAAGPSPDWTGLVRMVERARGLRLPENWWRLQNHLWDTKLCGGPARELARTIGFAS